MIYRLTAEQSTVIKLSRFFKDFNEVFLNTINDLKESEMNKNENNKILHLEEFANVLINLIKPENMEKANYSGNNNIIDINKMDEEEDIV